MVDLITENLELWSSTYLAKKTAGRGSSAQPEAYGIKKLRELILELAIRGKLLPQNPNDEPASVLLEKITAEKEQLIKEGKLKRPKKLPAIDKGESTFHLPASWEWVRLQDVSTYIQRGKGPKYSDSGSIRVISQKCIQWAGFDLSQARYVDDSSLDGYQPERYLQKHDLLWNSTGTGTVGRVNVLLEPNANQLVADSHVTVIRPLKVNSMFLWCYIASPGIQQRISPSHENTLVSGTTKQVELNTSVVIPLVVPLPPIEEQKRIVAKVGKLMALCDRLEAQQTDSIEAHQTLVETLLNTLTSSKDTQEFQESWNRIAEHFDTLFTTDQSIETLKQTILQLAVMGKLVPQDLHDEPAGVLLEKIEAEKERLVKEAALRTKASDTIDEKDLYISAPSNWEWIRLGNLAKFIDYRGRTPKKIESGVRLITAKNVRFGYIDLEPEEFISEEEYNDWMTRGFPRIGDVLFTPEAPLGNVAVVDIEEKFALAQRAICFQLHEAGMGDYLKLFIMAPQFQNQLLENATGMTATGIKAAKLKEIPIAIPPLSEQRRIIAKVDELMALCDTLKKQFEAAQITQIHLADAIVEQAVK